MAPLLRSLIEPIKGFVQLCAPQLCFACHAELNSSEKELCTLCKASLPRTYYETQNGNPCEQKLWGKVLLHSAFSIYHYRKGEILQEIIHSFKYNRNKNIAISLGKEMGHIIHSLNLHNEYDFLLPVPLHKHKEAQRGYNQSYLLAQGISLITQLPIRTDILQKHKETTSQTKRERFQRYINTLQVYSLIIPPEQLIGKRILIIDDVLTTGCTIEACCNQLKDIPNIRLGVATLACASN